MTEKYKIKISSKYKKNYKKMYKRGLDTRKLDNIIHRLSFGEKLEERYKDHILKGKYNGYHECHVQPDWLLIYKIQNDILILTLVDTGTHSDLFNK